MSSDEPLRALYQRALAETPVPGGDHPHDALWERVLCDDAPPEGRRRVQDHVLTCQPCAEIYRSLFTVRHEAARFDPAVRTPASPMRWIPYALAAPLLLAAVLTPFVWRAWSQPAGNPVTEFAGGASQPSTAPAWASLARHPAFRLDKAPVMLSASLALTPRGAAEDRQRLLDALGEALAPYRADDFPEAASRLAKLSEAYPDMVEPALYAGVAFLLSRRPADAVVHLERARSQAPAEFLDEIDWRLGLAYVHAGLPAKSEDPFRRICTGFGPYRDRACEALKTLSIPR